MGYLFPLNEGLQMNKQKEDKVFVAIFCCGCLTKHLVMCCENGIIHGFIKYKLIIKEINICIKQTYFQLDPLNEKIMKVDFTSRDEN